MTEQKKIETWARIETWIELIFIDSFMRAILASLISLLAIVVCQRLGMIPVFFTHWLHLLFTWLTMTGVWWPILSILTAIQRHQENALMRAQWHGQWVIVTDDDDLPTPWPIAQAVDWLQAVADDMADPGCYDKGEKLSVTFTLVAQADGETIRQMAQDARQAQEAAQQASNEDFKRWLDEQADDFENLLKQQGHSKTIT